jgi:hypothetical protein
MYINFLVFRFGRLYMRLFDYEYPLLLLLETKDHPMLLKCHWEKTRRK